MSTAQSQPPTALGPRDTGVGCVRVDRCWVFPLETEDDGLLRAMTVTGQPKRPEEFGHDPGRLCEEPIKIQALGESLRCAHWANSVRRGRPDADRVEVKCTQRHDVS